jgi:hypothetical protein
MWHQDTRNYLFLYIRAFEDLSTHAFIIDSSGGDGRIVGKLHFLDRDDLDCIILSIQTKIIRGREGIKK